MKSDVLTSDDECIVPPEIDLLKWICNPDEEENGDTDAWEDLVYEREVCKCIDPKKRRTKKEKQCCKDGSCKKEKAVLELLRFMKVIKENISNIKECTQKGDGDTCSYMTVEPTCILARTSAKLLEYEKRLKRLTCSKNDTCRLINLIKSVQRNILLQFICGPRANEALTKIVRDVAFIDCVLTHLEESGKCVKICSKEFLKTLSPANILGCDDKAVNTEGERQDKFTYYDCPDGKAWPLDCCNKSRLYTYRDNGTKATEFEEAKKGTYYYDVPQVNRKVSTDVPFEGEIVLPREETNVGLQTEPCFTFKDCYEITTMKINRDNNKTVKELEKLPKLTSVTNDYWVEEESVSVEKIDSIKKTYITNLDGVEILADVERNNFMNKLTIICNNEPRREYLTTGNAPKINEHISSFRRDVYKGVKVVATKLIYKFLQERKN